MYLKYSLTGEIPEFNATIEKYFIPKFGDNEMWIKYCDSLYNLYYGNTEEYFKAYSDLLKSKNRTYKHILHTWYLELNDGEIIEFDESWDENNKNPLEEYQDKGEYYIINKRMIINKEFEVYISEDEEERLIFNNSYVKIPKSEIKKIYKKSKEMMI